MAVRGLLRPAAMKFWEYINATPDATVHQRALAHNILSFIMDRSSYTMVSGSSSAQLEKIPTAALYNMLHPIAVPRYSSRARFMNWGGTYACTPLVIYEPETEAQCALILELARREKKHVRFAGVGHSPSDLACTTEYMLRTTRLNKVLEVSDSASHAPGSLKH